MSGRIHAPRLPAQPERERTRAFFNFKTQWEMKIVICQKEYVSLICKREKTFIWINTYILTCLSTSYSICPSICSHKNIMLFAILYCNQTHRVSKLNFDWPKVRTTSATQNFTIQWSCLCGCFRQLQLCKFLQRGMDVLLLNVSNGKQSSRPVSSSK